MTINAGGAGLGTPYAIENPVTRAVESEPPLRQGSYRALGATANNFARESFMEELAQKASADSLEFRLAHLQNARLRAVLEMAAEKFGWNARKQAAKAPDTGIGLACGTEKGSYVAACAEVSVDRARKALRVHRVTQVFECGAILDPRNLMAQVKGSLIMALGGALKESIAFEDGKILNASLYQYAVPRFADVPELDVHLLDRRDLPSAGGGETPMIAVAPAIANAVYDAIGVRIRSMPIRLP
jgi:isoquinoline 1-oxidoreductase